MVSLIICHVSCSEKQLERKNYFLVKQYTFYNLLCNLHSINMKYSRNKTDTNIGALSLNIEVIRSFFPVTQTPKFEFTGPGGHMSKQKHMAQYCKHQTSHVGQAA